MKLQTLIAATVLTFSTGSLANNCKNGLRYCGWDLMNTGNYHDYIVAELRRAGYPTDVNNIYNDLFYCEDNAGGITFVKPCHGDTSCQYGGTNKNDYC